MRKKLYWPALRTNVLSISCLSLLSCICVISLTRLIECIAGHDGRVLQEVRWEGANKLARICYVHDAADCCIPANLQGKSRLLDQTRCFEYLDMALARFSMTFALQT